MAERKACRYCGKEMPKGSVFRHEKVMCEKRPKVAQLPVVAVTRRGRKPMKRATAKAIQTMAEAATKQIRNGHCGDCLFRGLDSALARELVTDAIRGGMSIETAPGFVRRALQAGR